MSAFLKIWMKTSSAASSGPVQLGFLTKRTYWPFCHSTAWYGPLPTIGTSFVKSATVSSVWSCQMCLGRIGMYIWRTWVLGRSVLSTSVVSSGAVISVTPASPM